MRRISPFLRLFLTELHRQWRNHTQLLTLGIYLLFLLLSLWSAGNRIALLREAMAMEESAHITIQPSATSKYILASADIKPVQSLEPGWLYQFSGCLRIIEGSPDPNIRRMENRATDQDVMLSPLQILCFFLPLVLFVLTYDTFSSEWESGLMVSTVAGPTHFTTIFLAKLSARLASGLSIAAISIGICLYWLNIKIMWAFSGSLGSISMIILGLALFSSIAGVAVSYFSRTTSASLARLAVLWLFWVLLLPFLLNTILHESLSRISITRQSAKEALHWAPDHKYDYSPLKKYEEQMRVTWVKFHSYAAASPLLYGYQASCAYLGTSELDFIELSGKVSDLSISGKAHGKGPLIRMPLDGGGNPGGWLLPLSMYVLLCLVLTAVPIVHFELNEIRQD